MENIINVLTALTADEVRGDLSLFNTLYGENASKKLDLAKIEKFSFWDNGQSVIIYDDNKAIFDCNYEVCYGLKRLTTCYNRDGLFIEFKNY